MCPCVTQFRVQVIRVGENVSEAAHGWKLCSQKAMTQVQGAHIFPTFCIACPLLLTSHLVTVPP
jgi:hypothetical protein